MTQLRVTRLKVESDGADADGLLRQRLNQRVITKNEDTSVGVGPSENDYGHPNQLEGAPVSLYWARKTVYRLLS